MTTKEILAKMEVYFPNAKCELKYHTPFQLLLAVILSAQTTDKQVNKVTKTLFLNVKFPDDIIKLGQTKLREIIKSIGLFRSKSKYIYNLSTILSKSKNNNKIPNTFEQLTKLPWVGEKTAKVILSELYKLPYIPVDTHVHRVTNRLGIVNTNNPLQTSKKIEHIVDNKFKNKAHHLLIFWGRYKCTAKKPNCTNCPFIKFCKYK